MPQKITYKCIYQCNAWWKSMQVTKCPQNYLQLLQMFYFFFYIIPFPFETQLSKEEGSCLSTYVFMGIHVFFVFIDLRWEVIVLFVAIGEIVDHRCLNCLFITLMLSDLFTKNIGNYHLLTNMITRSVKGDISYRFHLLF